MKYNATTLPWVLSKTSTEGDAVISQGYIQGTSVTLRIVFFQADNPAPVVPSAVTLRALVLNGTTNISNSNTFTTPVPGTYVTTIDTTGFAAGAYTWRFLATDSGGHKFYGEDEFVLLPYTGPSGP